jgi:hypothetical protein
MKNMTQKTFKQYRDYEWLSLGDIVVLVRYEDLMTGEEWFKAIPDQGHGIPGNLNADECCYHGWRGTTDDISMHALGCRKIIKISDEQWDKDRRSYRKITVGPDLKPDED